jgi:hypothetical protein
MVAAEREESARLHKYKRPAERSQRGDAQAGRRFAGEDLAAKSAEAAKKEEKKKR